MTDREKLLDVQRCITYLLGEANVALDPTRQLHKDNMYYLLGKMHYCLLDENRLLREYLNKAITSPTVNADTKQGDVTV